MRVISSIRSVAEIVAGLTACAGVHASPPQNVTARLATVRAAAGPPEGKYVCYMGSTHAMVGRIWIMPGGQYRILENGPVGRFSVNPKDRSITWMSGSNLKLKRRGWYLAPGVADRLRNEVDSTRHAIVLQGEGFEKTPFEASNWAASSFEKCYVPSS